MWAAGLVHTLFISALIQGTPAQSAEPRALEVAVHDLFRVPSGGFGNASARLHALRCRERSPFAPCRFIREHPPEEDHDYALPIGGHHIPSGYWPS